MEPKLFCGSGALIRIFGSGSMATELNSTKNILITFLNTFCMLCMSFLPHLRIFYFLFAKVPFDDFELSTGIRTGSFDTIS